MKRKTFHKNVWIIFWSTRLEEKKKMFCTKCGTAVDGVALFCNFCGCKIYNSYNEHPPGTDDEKEIISYYFKKGYKYTTIVLFLRVHHNINISIRTLKLRLQTYGLQKKNLQYDRIQLKTNNLERNRRFSGS